MTSFLRTVLITAVAVTGLTAVSPASAAPAAGPALCLTAVHLDRNTGKATAPTNRYYTTVPLVAKDGSLTPECEMGNGDNLFGVFMLKVALIRCYGIALVRDNYYDTATAEAVSRLQAAAGLQRTGRYTVSLGKRLKWPTNDDITGKTTCEQVPWISRVAAAPTPAQAADPVCQYSRRQAIGQRAWASIPYSPQGNCRMTVLTSNTRAAMYLRIALRRCYGANLDNSWRYDGTVATLVNNVRATANLPKTGVYDDSVRKVMWWPTYNDVTGAVRCLKPAP